MKKHRINDIMKNIIIILSFILCVYCMRRANRTLEERVPMCVVVL
jgi:hypothetical protein